MTQHTAQSARSRFRGQNFMTPNALRYGWKGDLAYELSEGTGFRNNLIWGVTVVRSDGTNEYDLSRCFFDRDEAEAYIERRFTDAPA